MINPNSTHLWEYAGDGVSDTFAWEGRLFTDADLQVRVDGTLQVLGIDYTVTGAGGEAGGNVVFEAAAVPIDGAAVVVKRRIVIQQAYDVQPGPLDTESLERELDRAALAQQTLQAEIDAGATLEADIAAQQASAAAAAAAADAGAAAASADAAAASAATANLPTYQAGDEGKPLVVEDDLSGAKVGEWPAVPTQPFPRGYKAGGAMTVTAARTVSIAAGARRSDANDGNIDWSAALTLDLDDGGANGLDTGTVANATWYHVHVIAKAGGADVACLASTSIDAPVMPADYTLRSCIGSVLTDGSADIVPFVQAGGTVLWITPAADIDVLNPGTAAVLRTLSVPPGVVSEAVLDFVTTAGTLGHYLLITSPGQTDVAPSIAAAVAYTNAAAGIAGRATVITNTSSQIRSRHSASGAANRFIINTHGWIDPRGAA